MQKCMIEFIVVDFIVKDGCEVVYIISGTGVAICTAVVVLQCNSRWQC
jgi:hypothetical protein